MKMLLTRTLVVVLGSGFLCSTSTWAASVLRGSVTFLGSDGYYQAAGKDEMQFRFRVTSPTCKDGTVETKPNELWFNFKSGPIDVVRNKVSYTVAYSTLLTAFLTGKNVQIDQLPNCTGGNITSGTWIGIF